MQLMHFLIQYFYLSLVSHNYNVERPKEEDNEEIVNERYNNEKSIRFLLL